MSFLASKQQETRRFTGTVPEDLITCILLRVPAKDLVGCKLVSKSWLSLISSPNFTKSHLAITAAEEKDQIHIVHSYNNEDVDKDAISLINLTSRQLITHLNFPSMLCYKIVGSACGIVCIRPTIADKLYLWNPATNQSKHIYSPSSRSDVDEALGFGFDEIDNDFKIVRVTWRIRPTCVHKKHTGNFYAQDCEEINVEVYSSNRNAWRKLPGKPADIPYRFAAFEVYVNTGVLCAAGCHGIITFDLHTEVLNCAAIKYPVPTFVANINNFSTFDGNALVTNYKDSIAVIVYKHVNNIYDDTCKFNLWALDNVACLRDGGLEASWTLVDNIDVKLPIFLVHGYLDSGDFLFYLLNNKLCLYNSDTKEARYFNRSFFLGQIFKYSKSLFTIPGFKQVNWNAPPQAD